MSNLNMKEARTTVDDNAPLHFEQDGTFYITNKTFKAGVNILPGPIAVTTLPSQDGKYSLVQPDVKAKKSSSGTVANTLSLKQGQFYFPARGLDAAKRNDYLQQNHQPVTFNYKKELTISDVANSDGKLSLDFQVNKFLDYLKNEVGLDSDGIQNLSIWDIYVGFTMGKDAVVKLNDGSAVTLTYSKVFPKIIMDDKKIGFSKMSLNYLNSMLMTQLKEEDNYKGRLTWMEKYGMTPQQWQNVVTGMYYIYNNQASENSVLIAQSLKTYTKRLEKETDPAMQLKLQKIVKKLRTALIAQEDPNPFENISWEDFKKLRFYPGVEHTLSDFKPFGTITAKIYTILIIHSHMVHANTYKGRAEDKANDTRIQNQKDNDVKPISGLDQMKNIAKKVAKIAYGQRISFSNEEEMLSPFRFLPAAKDCKTSPEAVSNNAINKLIVRGGNHHITSNGNRRRRDLDDEEDS